MLGSARGEGEGTRLQPRRPRGRRHRRGARVLRQPLRAPASGAELADGVRGHGRSVPGAVGRQEAATGRAPARRARRRRRGGGAPGARRDRREGAPRAAASISSTRGETTSRSSPTRTSSSRRRPRCCAVWAPKGSRRPRARLPSCAPRASTPDRSRRPSPPRRSGVRQLPTGYRTRMGERPGPGSGKGARGWTLATIAVLALAGGLWAAGPTGAQVAAGREGPPFELANGVPTARPEESKLWWHDGHWWGSLWSDRARDFHIFRLAGGRWHDTGVADRHAGANPRGRARGRASPLCRIAPLQSPPCKGRQPALSIHVRRPVPALRARPRLPGARQPVRERDARACPRSGRTAVGHLDAGTPRVARPRPVHAGLQRPRLGRAGADRRARGPRRSGRRLVDRVPPRRPRRGDVEQPTSRRVLLRGARAARRPARARAHRDRRGRRRPSQPEVRLPGPDLRRREDDVESGGRPAYRVAGPRPAERQVARQPFRPDVRRPYAADRRRRRGGGSGARVCDGRRAGGRPRAGRVPKDDEHRGDRTVPARRR